MRQSTGLGLAGTVAVASSYLFGGQAPAPQAQPATSAPYTYQQGGLVSKAVSVPLAKRPSLEDMRLADDKGYKIIPSPFRPTADELNFALAPAEGTIVTLAGGDQNDTPVVYVPTRMKDAKGTVLRTVTLSEDASQIYVARGQLPAREIAGESYFAIPTDDAVGPTKTVFVPVKGTRVRLNGLNLEFVSADGVYKLDSRDVGYRAQLEQKEKDAAAALKAKDAAIQRQKDLDEANAKLKKAKGAKLSN